MSEKSVKIQHLGRLHKVNFDLDPRKHTVFYAEQAKRATNDPLMGWANPGSSKGYLGDTQEEVIERIRQQLAIDIAYWDPKADLRDYSFNVAFEEVRDGALWTMFRLVHGTNLKVHEFNKWGA